MSSSSLAVVSAAAGAAAVVPGARTTALGRRLRASSSRARHNRKHVLRATAASASAAASADDNAKLLKQTADAVSEDLKGVSITFVGDNEGANAAVASALAKALKYTPLSTPELIERITDSTREEIIAEARGWSTHAYPTPRQYTRRVHQSQSFR